MSNDSGVLYCYQHKANHTHLFFIVTCFVLRAWVQAALKTKDGKQKVCEAALEFIRLGWVYSAYMHAFPQLEQSPLSFLYIQTEHHNPVRSSARVGGEECACIRSRGLFASEAFVAVFDLRAKEDLTVQDGETFVVAAKEKLSLEGEEKLSLEGEEKPSLEGEAKESGEGADGGPSQGKANVTQRTRDPKRVAASPDQPLTVFGGNDEADAAQVAQPEGETKRVLKEVLVLRHSNPGMAFPSSRVKFVAVLPMTSAEAREAFKEGRVIGEADLADLKDAVTKHRKCSWRGA